VLLSVAQGLLEGQALVSVSMQDPTAVATLITDGILIHISTDRVKFLHDLFADWAIACALSEDSQRIKNLAIDALPPFWLSRGFELACRRLAEGDDREAWPGIIKDLESRGAKSGWTALALLALVRSEHANTLLERHVDLLLEGKGDRAANLIRRVIASHGQPAEMVLKDVLPAGVSIPKGLILPAGPQWPQLIIWCLAQFDRLPPNALAAAISLFEGWLTLAAVGENALSPLLLDRFADVLVAEIEEHDRPLPGPGEVLPKIRYAVGRDALESARLQLALYARSSQSAAGRYLSAIAKSKQSSRWMLQLLEFPGNLATAAPTEFSAAFLSSIRQDAERDGSRRRRRRRHLTPSMVDGPFVLGRCGIGLFVDLLSADQNTGIELIRRLVRSSENPPASNDGFVLTLAGRDRWVCPVFSYGWSRGNAPSTIVAMALKALEYWAHKRIEAGELLDDVVRLLVGEGPISGALLLVIVDVVLSHSPLSGKLLGDLVASPRLLRLDTPRAQHDVADKMSGGSLGIFRQSRHPSDAAIEQSLAERTSRTIALHNAITQIVLRQSDEATADLRAKLAEAVTRLGAWSDASVDWTSEVFMASHAHRLASKANYELITETDANGETREGWSFHWTEEQARWSQEHTSGVVAENTAFNRSLALRMAMDDDQKSVTITVADAEAVLLATADASPHDAPEHHDPNDPWLSRLAAAAFLARFGSNETAAAQQATLSAIFDRALQQASGELPNLRYDVMYDAHALAIAGRLYLASRFQRADDRRALLNAASTNTASAAAAISRHRQAAKNIGDQPLRSAIRIGLQACEFPRQKNYDEEQAAFDARQARLSAIKSTRLAAELHWLEHGGDEPAWPSPPLRRQRRPQRSIVLPGGKPKPRRARPEPNGRTPTLMIAPPLCGCAPWRYHPAPAQLLRCSTRTMTGSSTRTVAVTRMTTTPIWSGPGHARFSSAPHLTPKLGLTASETRSSSMFSTSSPMRRSSTPPPRFSSKAI
jgi:hypothetical protein